MKEKIIYGILATMLICILALTLVGCGDKVSNVTDRGGDNSSNENNTNDNNNNDNNGGTGGQQDEEVDTLTYDDIINGIGPSLKTVYHEKDSGGTEEMETVYKVGNDILSLKKQKKKDGDWEKLNDSYYKYTENGWDYYLISNDGTRWVRGETGLVAEDLFNGISKGRSITSYRKIFTDYSDVEPISKVNVNYVSTEDITIPGGTYNCIKYEYYNYAFQTTANYWVAKVNDIECCLKYTNTDSEGVVEFSYEIEVFETSGVAFPTEDIPPLP
ncbi:MAG TPA: hypothetical protein PKX91_01620 [Clostridia bacterium]|jgi:hypothetical protein|nr:hypothetical protein [Clostridia bacterium]